VLPLVSFPEFEQSLRLVEKIQGLADVDQGLDKYSQDYYTKERHNLRFFLAKKTFLKHFSLNVDHVQCCSSDIVS
jgi:predicted RNA-binding protein with EMAP domain